MRLRIIWGTTRLPTFDYERLADRIWALDSPDAQEAALVIRNAGRTEQLHQRALCTRVRRFFVGLIGMRMRIANTTTTTQESAQLPWRAPRM